MAALASSSSGGLVSVEMFVLVNTSSRLAHARSSCCSSPGFGGVDMVQRFGEAARGDATGPNVNSVDNKAGDRPRALWVALGPL